jgi:hypothetical protein
MRLTVGPLPAAVYWRRRAFVLVVLFLAALVVWTSCSGAAESNKDGSGSLTPTLGTPSDTGAPKILTPIIGTSASASGSASATASASATSAPCTDAELLLTAAANPNPTKVATTTTLTFKIKNVSGRTCERDVGGLPQELRILQGSTLIWSSDHCKPAGTSFIQKLAPGGEVMATVYWDGRKTVRDGKVDCTKPAPLDMRAPAGDYLVVGRLQDAYSPVVQLRVND